MSIVSTHWTEKNLNKIKIIDCSWHMPNINRNGYEEYLKTHIENAIFFASLSVLQLKIFIVINFEAPSPSATTLFAKFNKTLLHSLKVELKILQSILGKLKSPIK